MERTNSKYWNQEVIAFLLLMIADKCPGNEYLYYTPEQEHYLSLGRSSDVTNLQSC